MAESPSALSNHAAFETEPYGDRSDHATRSRNVEDRGADVPSSLTGDLFVVDENSGLPIWAQLRNRLTYLIRSGALKEGEQLPGVRNLAAQAHINYNTVSRAYRDLQLAAGMMYGPWLGAALILVGCVISSAFIFELVHRLGAPFVQSTVPVKYMDKFREFEKTGKLNSIVFILFLIPGMPKDVFTYIVPLTDMPMKHASHT